jgi:hypothetical protein
MNGAFGIVGGRSTMDDNFLPLTETFRMLGVPHPEQYARGEIEDPGLLAMVVFLKHMEARLVRVGDPNWRVRACSDSGSASVRQSLERVCNAGLDPNDVTQFIRTIQVHLLQDVCYLLDGLAYQRFPDAKLEARTCHTAWGLFTVNNRWEARFGRGGQPQAYMGSLHEVIDDVIRE